MACDDVQINFPGKRRRRNIPCVGTSFDIVSQPDTILEGTEEVEVDVDASVFTSANGLNMISLPSDFVIEITDEEGN